MNHESVKQRLLADPVTRAAYERPPLPLAVARAVVTRRRALDLSQQDLAERLGTSPMQVWRIESGQANLTVDTLARLAAILDLEIDVRVVEAPRPKVVGQHTS